MKKTLLFITFISIMISVNSQIVEVLEDDLFNGPEGIIYDEEQKLYYVINAEDGRLLTIDSLMNVELFKEGFGTGMSMEIINDSLLISSNAPAKISCIDKYTGEIHYQINLSAIQYPSNMVYDDRSGIAYLVCQEGRLAKIDVGKGTCNIFVDQDQGLVYGSQTAEIDTNDNRLFVWSWPNAYIRSVNIDDSTDVINLDHSRSQCISSTRDKYGDIYVSSWYGGGKIYKYDPEVSSDPEVFYDGDELVSPAGITYNSHDECYAVCTYEGNTVVFLYTTVFIPDNNLRKENSIDVYPNPVTEDINIYFKGNPSGFSRVELIDSSGSIVHSLNIPSGIKDSMLTIKTAENLKNGIYFLKLFNDLYPGKYQCARIIINK